MPSNVRTVTLALILALLFPPAAFSHGGRTDSNGGHNDRKNGGYHYHNSGYTKQTPSSTYRKPSSYTPGTKPATASTVTDQRIGEYFRHANENVGALNCSVTKTRRYVKKTTKEHVKSRDGHQCVICGSTVKLEVDHKRALMNGGSNSIDNLATLCDDCHTKKTRMDSSLRRKREKICRN